MLPPILAVAAPAPVDYSKKPIAIYGKADDPLIRKLQGELSATGRFQWLEAAPASGQTAEDFVKNVGGRGYVLVPRVVFGNPRSDTPRVSTTEKSGGGFDAVAAANLECPYVMTIDVYDAATARKVGEARGSETLSRRFEYRYDEDDSAEEIQRKAHELARVMAREAGRPPAEAFATQAERARDGLVADAVRSLKSLPAFRLEVRVSGWSADTDRIAFNLGRELRIRLDEGFAVMKGDRQIGYLKVRSIGDTLSEAQPLYLDEMLAPTDRVIEAPKSMWNHGLRVGGGWLGGPFAKAGYVGEVDIGPTFGASERYLTFGLGGVSDMRSTNLAFDMGLAQKFYARRWAARLGVQAGYMGLGGPTATAGLVGGLEYHFNEHVLWALDLEQTTVFLPLTAGVLGRSGLTVLF